MICFGKDQDFLVACSHMDLSRRLNDKFSDHSRSFVVARLSNLWIVGFCDPRMPKFLNSESRDRQLHICLVGVVIRWSAIYIYIYISEHVAVRRGTLEAPEGDGMGATRNMGKEGRWAR